MSKLASWGEVIKSVLLNKRMMSFYWQTGWMLAALIVNQLIVLIDSTGLNTPTIMVSGVILNQISKGVSNILAGK